MSDRIFLWREWTERLEYGTDGQQTHTIAGSYQLDPSEHNRVTRLDPEEIIGIIHLHRESLFTSRSLTCRELGNGVVEYRIVDSED